MSRIHLTDAQKAAVVTIVTSKIRPKTITEIARCLKVSTRTIGRVLEERGVMTTSQAKKAAGEYALGILAKYGIPLQHLESLILAPAVTAGNVALFLRQSNPAQREIILAGAGIAGYSMTSERLKEIIPSYGMGLAVNPGAST